jgi:cytochrome c peroxidase
VPGLRQLATTAPYMHDGSLATIEAVVQHYSALDEERLHADGERILRRLDLSAQEASDLAAFLRSLSAPAAQSRGGAGRSSSPASAGGAAGTR